MTAQPADSLAELIARARSGDRRAADLLFEAVYDDLRKAAQRLIAGESPGATLGATAVVHEAFLRLRRGSFPPVADRRHLLNTAAVVLRRILLEHARSKSRIKRGGGALVHLPLDPQSVPAVSEFGLDRFEDVSRALDELAEESPDTAQIVVLRVMLGLTVPQVAEVTELGTTTVRIRSRFGIAWLRTRLGARTVEADE